MLDYLGSSTSDIIPPSSTNEKRQPQDIVNIKKLIARLVPYSKHLQGTKMGIRFEKKCLTALIPSPVVNAEGYWRWFITFAPADLYEKSLFEITSRTDNENYTWDERRLKVRRTILEILKLQLIYMYT